MPFAKYNNKNIYYQVHGEGEPLIILNGVMMSHLSWQMFLPELTKNNQVILLDFFDQGKSDRMEDGYSQDIQVEVVKAVIDQLNLEKVNLFGISYGGEIAMKFALKYQEYLQRLLLFNTTAYTNPWLQDIGKGWVDAAKTHNGQLFYNITIPIIYSPYFYTNSIQWMNQRKEFLYGVFNEEFLTATIRLIESANDLDLREQLGGIKVDTLVVSSDTDFVTPACEQEFIHQQITNSTYIQIKNCGHASMYERPREFTSILKGFLL
jgi:pimeloyl-ACP methyl ester carboxylesterase